MSRCLFNVLAIACHLLFISSLGLWGYSMFSQGDYAAWKPYKGYVDSGNNELNLNYLSFRYNKGVVCGDAFFLQLPNKLSPGTSNWEYFSNRMPAEYAQGGDWQHYLTFHSVDFQQGNESAIPAATWSMPLLTSAVQTVKYHGISFELAMWPIALASSAAVSWWWIDWAFSWRRTANGLCRSCGYDLRATPKRCPECGAVA